jgi:hypothetical protein
MTTAPECPRCDERGMVEVIRANWHDGSTWWFCRCCSSKILTDKGGVILTAHK